MECQLISIIIPVYNVEKYIRKCLDSVCGQTYRNLEIIIVDDGSSDLSGEICEEYQKKDARIRIIRKKNEGQSAARNTGLEQAKGDFIMFVDSDDWIAEDMVAYLYENLEERKADLAICGFYSVIGETEKKYAAEEDAFLSREEALKELVDNEGKIQNYVWVQMWKRDLTNDIRFPVGRIFEDMSVTYQVIEKADHILLLKEAKYYYNHREGSTMMKKNEGVNLMRCFAHEERYKELGEQYPEFRADLLRQYFYAYRKMVRDTVKEKVSDLDIRRRFFCEQAEAMRENSKLRRIEKMEIDILKKYKGGFCVKLYILEAIRILKNKWYILTGKE